ncbi:MAG: C69 family dipeptidase [Bacteroidota bacterium]|nr:C69 family dipeptidase [Bacteroidota bacterium]
MRRIKIISFLATFVLLISAVQTNACTNYLITKGASVDGSTMISYAADSHVLYGELYYWEGKTYEEGAMKDIYEWDTGKYLGQIEQVKKTFTVIGNMNENQVGIGETTYGGLSELGSQKGAIMDYGSLIYTTLQRAKSARHAIKIMTELVEKYGYYSVGESFSISDKDEVWILELIGKGEGEKGAVWVARMIPDGYVSGHANQARITTFPQEGNKSSISSKHIDDIFNKGVTTVYAEDVISFAKEKGFYKGKDKNFSFSDTYAPITFSGARFCEARVWSMFRDVNKNMEQYEDYAMGHNLENRMPLWIKPDNKVSVQDMFSFMRNHLEGTKLDMTKDMGAGPFKAPYRWRPLTWKVDGKSYCNERATATQQTGFSFVIQSRNWLPDHIGGINWFSVDDASSAVYTPIYCGTTEIPETFAVGNGTMGKFSDKSAFWIFNQVSNLAYTRYNEIHPVIEKVQKNFEDKYVSYVPAIDKAALMLLETNPKMAQQFITDFSVNTANDLTMEWKNLYQFLFVKYVDGNIKKTNGRHFIENEHKNGVLAGPDQPGYGEEWYKKIVNETGDHFKVVGKSH